MTFYMKLQEIREEGYAEGYAEGYRQGVFIGLVESGQLDISTAAECLNMTVEEFQAIMDSVSRPK